MRPGETIGNESEGTGQQVVILILTRSPPFAFTLQRKSGRGSRKRFTITMSAMP